MINKKPGRRPGYQVHTEAFEALLALKGFLRKALAEDCDLSPQFIADLCAHRGGATREVADRIAQSLSVPTPAIFPELSEFAWVAPKTDRTGKRIANKARVGAAA